MHYMYMYMYRVYVRTVCIMYMYVQYVPCICTYSMYHVYACIVHVCIKTCVFDQCLVTHCTCSPGGAGSCLTRRVRGSGLVFNRRMA